MGLTLLALLVACGPEPLAGLGGGASDWIGEPTVPTVATTIGEEPTLIPVVQVEWYNDNLTPVPGTSPAEVIAGVFARSSPTDRFAQATPAEIAAALPELAFPSRVPPEVRFITSQLVYDRSTGQLATDQVAAFGLWNVEPYTQSRSVGQVGVINVVLDVAGADLIDSGAADLTCGRFASYAGECAETELGGLPAWEFTDETGSTLIWYEGDYRYEFFLRVGTDPELLPEVAASFRPLTTLANG